MAPGTFRLLPRAFGVLLWLATAASLRAHTTEMVGGRLGIRADGMVELRLEIAATRLPVFVNELPQAFTTWGHVREKSGALADCFQKSLVVYSAGNELAPAAVELPELANIADAVELPEFVTVLVLWRGLSAVPTAVIPRFDLFETTVMLILDESLGGPATAEGVSANPTESPAALAEPPVARSSSSWWRLSGRALVIGYEHIVPMGLDHILFVLGLYFAARRFRDLLWQVTMFTVAHSITLGLAMGGVVVLGETWSTAVEIGIAVSIVAVAVENCFVRHSPGWRRLSVVGAFGLIHGLGFAGALSEVNWPADQFAIALLAANVGIELGQLTVVGGAALLTAWAWQRAWYRGGITVPASLAIGACGLYWAIERAAGVIG